jgi:TonB-dependent starch-binding outer membrane protein SusC
LVTSVPSFAYPANVGATANRDFFYAYSDVLVERGDNIRLQDVRLDYELTRQQIKKMPFRSVVIYSYVSNLGILWKANNKGIDPDYIPSNYYVQGLPGISVSAGIKIDF